jgi:hypothetical protein
VFGGRRVVDGSSTAATGHERQEPHQLPAHAPLYLGPPGRPPLLSLIILPPSTFSLYPKPHSLSQNRSVSLSRPAARPRRLLTGMLLAMSSQDQEGNQPASRAAVCERDHVLRCCFIELAR